jgi:hypothetical protein
MLCANMARSAEPGYILSATIADAKKQGIRFSEHNLFTNTGSTKQHTGTEEVLLSANNKAVAELLANAPEGVSLSLLYKGKTYTLALLRSNSLSRKPIQDYTIRVR